MRLRFDRPMALTRHDCIVLRAASPQVTLGRATVLDPEPARSGVRTAAACHRFERLAGAEDAAATVLLEQRAAAGLDREELVRRAGLDPSAAARVLRDLEQDGRAVSIGVRAISASLFADLEARAEEELAAFHSARPEEPGMARAALRERLGTRPAPDVFEAVIARLSARGVVRGTDRVALTRHEPPAASQALQLQATVEQRVRSGGLTPPDLTELSAAFGATHAALTQAVQALVREKRLVKVGPLVVHKEPLEQLKNDVAALREGRPSGERVVLEVADFKARFGLTRKHAIPLLEWLDRERVTRRQGDARLVL